MARGQPVEVRFWSKVDKSGGESACWPWTASLDGRGYGQLSMGHDRMVRAHRLALELSGVEVSAAAVVCHTCDNRLCCNPAHLWLGTNEDNLQDMANKGRARNAVRFGVENHKHKLTPESVLAIRRRSGCGESRTALAREYGIAVQSVSRIARGLSWSWLSPEVEAAVLAQEGK